MRKEDALVRLAFGDLTPGQPIQLVAEHGL